MTAPLSLIGYRLASFLATPLAGPILAMRLRRGKEDPRRVGERRGLTGLVRPPGPLVWLHGASVGEAAVLLPFVERITRMGATALVTTTTVTSAAMLAQRLPAGALHQYAPLDSPVFVRRFIKRWRPDATLVAESELWPNMIVELKRSKSRLAMVNGRISERSFRRWGRAPRFIAALLTEFDVCLARSEADGDRLSRARRAERPGRRRHQVRRADAAGRPARARRARGPHLGAPDVDRRLDPRGRRDDRGGRAQAPRPGVSRRADPDRAAPSRAGRGDLAAIGGAGPQSARCARAARRSVRGLRSTSATRSASWGFSIVWPAWCSSASPSSPAAGRIRSNPRGSPRPFCTGRWSRISPTLTRRSTRPAARLTVARPEDLGETLIALFANAARLRAMARAAGDTVERRAGAVDRSMGALKALLPAAGAGR